MRCALALTCELDLPLKVKSTRCELSEVHGALGLGPWAFIYFRRPAEEAEEGKQ